MSSINNLISSLSQFEVNTITSEIRNDTGVLLPYLLESSLFKMSLLSICKNINTHNQSSFKWKFTHSDHRDYVVDLYKINEHCVKGFVSSDQYEVKDDADFVSEYNQRVELSSKETEIIEAIIKNEFFLEYQPQIDTKENKLIGLEALIRWQHPDKGRIPPSDFIPVAEKSNLIVLIGEWVINAVCKQKKEWNEKGFTVPIHINFSYKQFKNPGLVTEVKQRLRQFNLKGKDIGIELTETSVMVDTQDTIRRMKEVQKLGVVMSIDDFGTGYSSLEALKIFPFDILKIDQMFIRSLPNEKDIVMIESILHVARSLNLIVVAEGVETHKVAQFLEQRGCYIMQGYYFSKPLSSKEIAHKYI